jgi:hypothetical protein
MWLLGHVVPFEFVRRLKLVIIWVGTNFVFSFLCTVRFRCIMVCEIGMNCPVTTSVQLGAEDHTTGLVEGFVFFNQHRVWTNDLLLETFLTLFIRFGFNKTCPIPQPGSIFHRSRDLDERLLNARWSQVLHGFSASTWHIMRNRGMQHLTSEKDPFAFQRLFSYGSGADRHEEAI